MITMANVFIYCGGSQCNVVRFYSKTVKFDGKRKAEQAIDCRV